MQTVNGRTKKLIGRAEKVALPELGWEEIPARVDTGARTSSIWASNVQEQDGELVFMLFDRHSPFYTGQLHRTTEFDQVVVASSTGHVQERYKVRLLVKIKGKKIRSRFTLANRAQQVYPVLLGRNTLKGKFIVDVTKGKPLYHEERQRSETLQSKLPAEE